MKVSDIPLWRVMVFVLLGGMFWSCNIDDDIEALPKPQIVFDSSDGIYTVKIGHELTLAPQIVNGDGAEIAWSIDGEVVCREPSFTRVWTVPGRFYVSVVVSAAGGTARDEIAVDVLEKTPPQVSLRTPEGGIRVARGTDYRLAPIYRHDDVEGFGVRWLIDGGEVHSGREYVFHTEECGRYIVTVEAYNADGATRESVMIDVVEHLDAQLRFELQGMNIQSTNRYTIPGRTVWLSPVAENLESDVYIWSVNGSEVNCRGKIFAFTPSSRGNYHVTVEAGGASASMTVCCVDATEMGCYRAPQPSSSVYATDVWEWVPAPGQFIGDAATGMTDDMTTLGMASRWAQSRLADNLFVSLGAWGGYITVMFDHSVRAGAGEYDFAIMGNAISTSNEPGIVYVMQDLNGNGVPDEQWYELRGSEFDTPAYMRDYAVTYYRPTGTKMPVEWTDESGRQGTIDYMGGVHNQDTYYPRWIHASSYTLRGSRLEARNIYDSATGDWSNPPYGWGYADNLGSDLMAGGDTETGNGQWAGFRISNAVAPDGTPVSLQYIDFVKVQTGALAKSGRLGELSTEVCGFRDFNK